MEATWRVPIVRADGPDVSRSAAGRAGGEAVWLPTALLPRFGVTWTVEQDTHLTASYMHDDAEFALRITLYDDGRIRSLEFDRWGEPPDNSGAFSVHPFGLDVTAYGIFDGITIPPDAWAGFTARDAGTKANSSVTTSRHWNW